MECEHRSAAKLYNMLNRLVQSFRNKDSRALRRHVGTQHALRNTYCYTNATIPRAPRYLTVLAHPIEHPSRGGDGGLPCVIRLGMMSDILQVHSFGSSTSISLGIGIIAFAALAIE